MSDQRTLDSFMGRATILGQPVNDPQHTELNAELKRSGWTDEQINHAHEVAAGNKPLTEACPDCEEQELYYSGSVLYEGRRLIICKHCGAQCHDRSEQAGPAILAAAMVNKAMKGVAGGGHAGRRMRRRPQG